MLSKLGEQGTPATPSCKQWELSIQPVSSTSANPQNCKFWQFSSQHREQSQAQDRYQLTCQICPWNNQIKSCGSEIWNHCRLRGMRMYHLISGAKGQRFCWRIQWSWDLACAFHEPCHCLGYAKNRCYKLIIQLNVTTQKKEKNLNLGNSITQKRNMVTQKLSRLAKFKDSSKKYRVH